MIKSNIFSLTLWDRDLFTLIFLLFPCYLLLLFQQTIMKKHLSGCGFMNMFLWYKAGLRSSHCLVCPLAPIPSVWPYSCFCRCRIKVKTRLTNQLKTSSFLTGVNHFLRTHKGQWKDGTSNTRTGQVIVTLPLNIFLVFSTLRFRDFLK